MGTAQGALIKCSLRVMANPTRLVCLASFEYKENEAACRVENPAQRSVEIIHVDGGIPRLDPLEKAGFALSSPGETPVWYVGLQGKRVEKGIQYLEKTLADFAHVHSRKNPKYVPW